ncbi:MAG: hypothetical protein PHP03_01630 [Candidatus Pacebacteria bacterium]|nr:hypothetical protein [Candidatus Paceibacterota bacterium]
MFKWIKEQWVTNIFTLVLAIGTIWLACETYQLKSNDLGPHVNIEDVNLQILDDTGSIIKDRSWLEGEKYNLNASSRKVKDVLLTVKFSNSGKQAGFVELSNYQDIIKKVSSDGGASEAFVGGRLLVPGNGKTGWSYTINIIKEFKGQVILDLSYKFDTYDVNGEEIGEKEIIVRCDFPEVSPGSINASCKPIYSLNKEKSTFIMGTTINYLFNKTVWQNVWANFLFALIGAIIIFIIFALTNKRKIYRIFGLDKKNRLSIYVSTIGVKGGIDIGGAQNLYEGPAVPENEFRATKEVFDLLSLIGEKDNLFIRFMKFSTFDVTKVEYKFPQNDIQVEADKETNILTIGGPGYNWATKYFQEKSKLAFVNNVFVNRSNGETIATPSIDYDYGILERINDGGRIIILAFGFHVNGTRGAARYLIDNWRDLPEEFTCLIKFPNPSRDINGYKKPLEIIYY